MTSSDSGAAVDEMNRAREAAVKFLLTEARLAMTLLDIAESSSTPAVRERNINNARAALDTIDRLLDQIDAGSANEQRIQDAANEVYRRLNNLAR